MTERSANLAMWRAGDVTRFRQATMDDAELLLKWRNDFDTCRASHNASSVGPDEHRVWLSRCTSSQVTLDEERVWLSQSGDRWVYIAEFAGVPVGTVRADILAQGMYLSWTVAPEHRGRGHGTGMVCQFAKSQAVALHAQVKPFNVASRRIAEAAGLSLVSETPELLYFSRPALSIAERPVSSEAVMSQ